MLTLHGVLDALSILMFCLVLFCLFDIYRNRHNPAHWDQIRAHQREMRALIAKANASKQGATAPKVDGAPTDEALLLKPLKEPSREEYN